MTMKRRVGIGGFTIVETMVVLAVTGVLFAMIATTLSGRQRSNEFIQAINDARAQIQQTIGEVQNGYFPDKDFLCTEVSGKVYLDAAPFAQGKRTACVFLGKVIQFNIDGQDASDVVVYPVAGLRSATDILTADPSVISNGQIDDSTTFNLKYGLTVEKTRVVSGPQNVGAFGVLSSIDSTNPGKSGDQQLDLYTFDNITLNHAKLTDANDLLGSFFRNPSGGFQICFKSGGTNQYGLLTIGNKGSQLSVEQKIMDSVCW